MRALADRYAAELTAQYRTLNLFASHAGEIGRAHEVFLRAVLTRFLPGRLRCGTGFIASRDGSSRQQDIIIFDRDEYPLLFEVGDCLVVDADAVAGTIEVKTRITSTGELDSAIRAQLDVEGAGNRGGFASLYVWEGLELETTLDYIWDQYRAAPNLAVHVMPRAIYVRGKYVLFPNHDGRRDTPPLYVLRLGEEERTEGDALLTFVSQMWIGGIQLHAAWPGWVWERYKRTNETCSLLPWPEDLQARADREQREAAR